VPGSLPDRSQVLAGEGPPLVRDPRSVGTSGREIDVLSFERAAVGPGRSIASRNQ